MNKRKYVRYREHLHKSYLTMMTQVHGQQKLSKTNYDQMELPHTVPGMPILCRLYVT